MAQLSFARSTDPIHAQRGKLVERVVVSPTRKRVKFPGLIGQRIQLPSLGWRNNFVLGAVDNQNRHVNFADFLLIVEPVEC